MHFVNNSTIETLKKNNGDKDQIEPWLLNLFENLPTCEQSSGNNSVINSLVSNLLDRLSEIEICRLVMMVERKGKKFSYAKTRLRSSIFLIKVDREQLFKNEPKFLLETKSTTSDYVIEKFHHCCHIIGDFKL
ncbi:hypothetical protein T12_1846 [Trichinella patagoniensis]|uniref:Uncharacterized protein n=1 Tax=Trichinella patagoniensis TaxID=990121 RepID=A0A0V1AF22_9BILA|nr:hypothetical protein T12_1846 [Trichinella patagoniensis]